MPHNPDNKPPAWPDSETESEDNPQLQTLTLDTPPSPGDLTPDNPTDEPLAEIVSADQAGALAEPGALGAAIEALLFASPDPLTPRALAKALGEVEIKTVRHAVKELIESYDAGGRGIEIREVAGGYQMSTRERHAEYILNLTSRKRSQALSAATLETLAIVAYRQPIIRAEVESIRGVESSGLVRNLFDLELIEVVGRKEVIGRPQMYGTTPKFLKAFGLRSLRDLPSIQGLRERFAAESSAAPPSPTDAAGAHEAPVDAPTDDRPDSADAAAPAKSAPETAEDLGADDSADAAALAKSAASEATENLEAAEAPETAEESLRSAFIATEPDDA